MGMVERADVVKMLHNQKLMNNIIEKALSDQDVINGLASDITNEVFESDIKNKIISVTINDPNFKQKIVNVLTNGKG